MSATSRSNRTALDATTPWKHGSAPVIGLIGAIGSGKSRVAASFGARGALVVDADAVGHRLLEEPAVRDRVIARFGSGVVARSNGPTADCEPRIDRKALAAVVFSDPAALEPLESILHPLMRREFIRIIEQTSHEGRRPAVVLDAAVLLEAGWDDLCDRVYFVDASRETRLQRVQRQRGWSADDLDARERAQSSLDRKRRRADAVIANDSDSGSDGLERSVERIWSGLRSAAPPERTSKEAAAVGAEQRRCSG